MNRTITIGPWFAVQGLRTATQIADYIISLQTEVSMLEAKIRGYKKDLDKVTEENRSPL